METKKIAIAIFVGIFVGAMVVLTLTTTPLLRWLLGVLVGSSVGLLLYDLKEVQEKAPLAWRATKRGSRYSLDWLKRPRPTMLLILVLLLISTLCFSKLPWSIESIDGEMSIEEEIFGTIILSVLLGMVVTIICMAILDSIISIGAEKKRMFFQASHKVWFSEQEIKKMTEKQYTQIPLNYRNVYGLMLIGFGCVALNVLRVIPGVGIGFGIGLWSFLSFIFYGMWVFLARFLWMLFKLISSYERILCAIYCAAGVTVIHILFGHQASLLGQKIIIAVSGGIIGAAVGVIHYSIVQLFLTPATNNT